MEANSSLTRAAPFCACFSSRHTPLRRRTTQATDLGADSQAPAFRRLITSRHHHTRLRRLEGPLPGLHPQDSPARIQATTCLPCRLMGLWIPCVRQALVLGPRRQGRPSPECTCRPRPRGRQGHQMGHIACLEAQMGPWCPCLSSLSSSSGCRHRRPSTPAQANKRLPAMRCCGCCSNMAYNSSSNNNSNSNNNSSSSSSNSLVGIRSSSNGSRVGRCHSHLRPSKRLARACPHIPRCMAAAQGTVECSARRHSLPEGLLARRMPLAGRGDGLM